MVIIFYGTGAELIKMLGVVQGIPRNEQLLICTSQQHAGLQHVHKQLGVTPDIYLAKGWKGRDVENMKQMLGLMLHVHATFASKIRKIRLIVKNNEHANSTKSVVLVHGDTLTTVAGAYLGRLLGLNVGHVEAGLRSGSWKSPFPEEIDRRIVSKIARIHFAPNDLAQSNLENEKVRGDIINTTFNTAKDAIEQADRFVSKNYKKLNLPKKYILVLLHRTELLESRDDLEAILKTIRNFADEGNDIVFTMHSTTAARIESYDFGQLLDHPSIRIIQKQPYFDFMAVVKASEAVVTDGGGLQEDTFFLGIPAIVHRARTERQEGLGVNSSLSGMDVAKVAKFLRDHKSKKDMKKLIDTTSPSEVVIKELKNRNFMSGAETSR